MPYATRHTPGPPQSRRADVPYKFEKLEVWQLAVRLIKLVYERAERLPKTETFGLGDQLRRSAVSIALNIAEGRAADTEAEFRRFLGIALRSLVEVVAAMKLCGELGLAAGCPESEVYALCDELEAKLRRLRATLAASSAVSKSTKRLACGHGQATYRIPERSYRCPSSF